MAKISTDELLDAFKEMTLIELSEFVKQFEDTFDVTAAAPVAVAAAPAAGGAGGGEAAAEQDEFDVVLEAAGDKKIQVIKEVRSSHQPRAEGGQGPRREHPEAGPGEGCQGRRREGQGVPRGRRRHGDAQVGRNDIDCGPSLGDGPQSLAWGASRVRSWTPLSDPQEVTTGPMCSTSRHRGPHSRLQCSLRTWFLARRGPNHQGVRTRSARFGPAEGGATGQPRPHAATLSLCAALTPFSARLSVVPRAPRVRAPRVPAPAKPATSPLKPSKRGPTGRAR